MSNIKYSQEEYRQAVKLYKEEHPTAESIPADVVVRLRKDHFISLGRYLTYLKRSSYQENKEMKDFVSAFFPKQFKKRRNTYKKKEVLEALQIYKEKNRMATFIPVDTKVLLKNGIEFPLGRYCNRIQQGKSGDKYHLSSEIVKMFPEQFSSRKIAYTESDILLAFDLYAQEHPKSFKIPSQAVVTLPNNKLVYLGSFCSNVKSGHTSCSLFLKERIESKFPFQFQRATTGRPSSLYRSLYKHYQQEFKEDKKAQRVARCLEEFLKQRDQKKKDISMDWILEEFAVDKKELFHLFTRIRLNDQKSYPSSISIPKKLSIFCSKNGFSYEKALRVFRLHSFCPNDTLEQLVNRVVTENKNEISTWIYESYGTSLPAKLRYLSFDSDILLKEMSQKIISLEEALAWDAFQKEKKKEDNNWLEVPFHYFLFEKSKEESSISFFEKLPLEKEECEILKKSILHYERSRKGFQILEVGLISDKEEKIRKIKEYQLSEEDIEESFLTPVSFGENSYLMNYPFLRPYILDWNEYNEEEKEELRGQFRQDEIDYICDKRSQIDRMIKQLKKK